MQTVVVDIISDKALKLLHFLERLRLIHVRAERPAQQSAVNWEAKYKGKMTKQSLEQIGKQLKDMREEWE
ncbi:MAG: hypothetical protein V4649_10160 [Bacteroidota bacterium]